MAPLTQLYRHVVLFQFKDNTPASTAHDIAAAFRTLCTKLPFVRGFEWGMNSSPENLNEGFSHCFIVTFAGPEDRDLYLPHPDHQEFCRRWLDPHLQKVCVVDFVAQA